MEKMRFQVPRTLVIQLLLNSTFRCQISLTLLLLCAKYPLKRVQSWRDIVALLSVGVLPNEAIYPLEKGDFCGRLEGYNSRTMTSVEQIFCIHLRNGKG